MSDDEVLRFEITDQDLDNEFNFDMRRPRMSKNQATYGIWAGDSDEDEDPDARPAFAGGGRAGAGRNAPVNFVSAGIQQSGKKKEEASGAIEDKPGSGSEDEEEATMGFSAGGRRRKKKIPGAKHLRQDMGEIAGMRTSGYQQPMQLGKGFGDWEKHTRGIGAKLLLKMGYESGKGLGKDLQGRNQIVEAFVRKGRGAIGAYGKEKSGPTAGKGARKVVDSEEEEEQDFKEKLQQWKRAGGSGGQVKKVKYVYKTADQVLEEGRWRNKDAEDPGTGAAGHNKVKVIDMTGKEQRVLSGYHAIAAQQMPDDYDGEGEKGSASVVAATRTSFDLPELRHNIDLILDKCEDQLITTDRSLKHHKNKKEVLLAEEEKLSALVDREKEQIRTLEDVLAEVERLEAVHEEGSLDLPTAKETFSDMKSNFHQEYQRYEIPYIAITIVAPLMKKELHMWRPLEDEAEVTLGHKSQLEDWQDILDLERGPVDQTTRPDPGSGDMSPFHALMWECWMPSLRAAIVAWSTRQPDKLTRFLEIWKDLMPLWMWNNVLDQLVLPKLQNDVELWDPLTDSVPLHSWLHPWLPFLGQQLEIVYPTIRNKLATALTGWHPSDRSARLILLPWKEVFPKGSLHAFVLKNIYPKLEQALQAMIINPLQQRLDEWNWVMEWTDLLAPAALVSLMDTHFFPKWLHVLAQWLNNNPNYDQVTKWYKGWKSVIPQEVINAPEVRLQLNRGLDMMTRVAGAQSGHPMSMQPGATEAVMYLSSMERGGPPPPPSGGPIPPPPPRIGPTSMGEAVRTAAQMADGYKDLVARRCEERGILFVPTVPAKYREGKHIYKCGRFHIYLDKSAILVQNPDGMWVPTSLNTLLDTAM